MSSARRPAHHHGRRRFSVWFSKPNRRSRREQSGPPTSGSRCEHGVQGSRSLQDATARPEREYAGFAQEGRAGRRRLRERDRVGGFSARRRWHPRQRRSHEASTAADRPRSTQRTPGAPAKRSAPRNASRNCPQHRRPRHRRRLARRHSGVEAGVGVESVTTWD